MHCKHCEDGEKRGGSYYCKTMKMMIKDAGGHCDIGIPKTVTAEEVLEVAA